MVIYYTDTKRHLVCIPYGVYELHDMATKLQLAKVWYHSKPYPHYDIPKRRIAEIESKCVIVSPKDIVRICRGEYDES